MRIVERLIAGHGGLVLASATVISCSFPPLQDAPDMIDTTPPEVIASEPSPHAASIDPGTSITVTFSEPISAGGGAQFVVTAADVNIAGTVVPDGNKLTFRPSAALPSGMPLAVTVAGVGDAAGNTLAAPYAFDFTTQTTLCVKPGGGGGCLALPSEAVAAAAAGASIAVAAGDYVDNISVDGNVALLGGFDAAFATRDASRATTIRPLAPAGDSRAIVTVTGGALLLDGFTLTDGNSGGEHGGAIRISGGTPRIQNSVIAGNTAAFLGGGIYITGGVSVQLIGNRIDNNTVGGQSGCSGGGIAVEGSTVTLRDNQITGNRVQDDMGRGGGIVFYGGVATLVNNRIDSNHVGGAFLVGNGGGIATSGAQVTITGGSISHNDVGDTTGAGAGVHAEMGEVRIDGVRIEGNTAGTQATAGANGVHSAGANLIVASSIIASNLRGAGGIVAGATGATVVINCTLADNQVRGITAASYLTVVNTAIVRHPAGITVTGTTAPPTLIRRNALFGNTSDAAGFQLEGSNLTVDPRLDASLHLAADSPLIDAGQPGRIQTANPAAAAVDPPDKDIDGDPRVLAGKGTAAPDIGADELRP